MQLGPHPLAEPIPPFVVRLILGLRRGLQHLTRLLAPPELSLVELSSGVAWTTLLGMAARHRLPEALANGPKSAEELAATSRLSADSLTRVLRALSSVGVFRVLHDGRFKNNRLSRALMAGAAEGSADFARYLAEPSSLQAWAALDAAVVGGGTAFSEAHGKPVWEHFDEHPEEREIFAQAMRGLTMRTAPIVAGMYPFGEVSRVCDVGGGVGVLLSELLVRFPHLRGAIYDGKGVLESADRLLQSRGIRSRARVLAGNFLTDVPGGFDCYLLKNILHDWGDERSGVVLGNVRRAMPPGGRVLVVESFLATSETRGLGPFSDVQMMVMCDEGRERSEDEYVSLAARAGFIRGRTFRSPLVDVLELVADD